MRGKPLDGKRVLIPRLEEDAEYSASLVRMLGGKPVKASLIRIEETHDVKKLGQIIERMENYSWLVFTSRNGVRIFMNRVRKLNKKIPETCMLAAVGPSTRREAEKQGLKISFTPSKFLTENLARELPDVRGRRILLVRSWNADNRMRNILESRGAVVDEVRPYVVKTREDIDLNLLEDFDMIVLTSPSIARAVAAIEVLVKRIRSGALVCCIGPVTAEEARRLGLRVDVIAEEHTLQGALESLVKVMGGYA